MAVVLALNRVIVMTCLAPTIGKYFGGRKWLYWTIGSLVYTCGLTAPTVTSMTNTVYHTGVGYFIRDVMHPVG